MSQNDRVEGVSERRRTRRLNFTDRSILALKPTTKLTDYWDSSLPGFGIRVAPTGFKTWIVSGGGGVTGAEDHANGPAPEPGP